MNEITTALTSVADTLTGTISIGNIAIIIGAVLSAAVVLYLGWFGIRKLISVVVNATKGRLKV